MRVMIIGVIIMATVVAGVVMRKSVPTLNAQSANLSSRHITSRDDAMQQVSSMRKPSQTRVPTRRPSHTPVVIKTKTRTKTKTKTRTPPRPSLTRTRTATRTQTPVATSTATILPTTTPSTLPTLTPTPVSVDTTDTIEFVNIGSSDWRVSVNGVSIGIEPVLLLQPNETYTFTVNAGPFHPLMISTDGSIANEYTDGVSPTGGSTSALTITLSSVTPATLYYVCANHPSMRGQLTVATP